MSLKNSFARAIAQAQYLYATRITAIPPQKVRSILEGQGWQFKSEEESPNPAYSAAAFGMAFAHHARHVITSPYGEKNIFTAGKAQMDFYAHALDRAARQAYGLNQ